MFFNFVSIIAFLTYCFLADAHNCSQGADSNVNTEDSIKLFGGSLSTYWAQEYIGADLAKSEMNIMSSSHKSLIKYGDFENIHLDSIPSSFLNPLLEARIDTNQNSYWQEYIKSYTGDPDKLDPYAQVSSHGTRAANLMVGSESGVTDQIRFDVLNASKSPNYSDGVSLAEEMIEKEIDLFSTSIIITQDRHYLALEKLAAHQIPIVIPSGNSFPDHHVLRGADNYIVVGSASPVGLVSSFSNSPSNLDILAPADSMIVSSFFNKPSKFSGTSAARPLVSGAIANVMSLLPGITQAEIEILINTTSIKTLGARLYGEKGIVNAYKIFRLAKKLRQNWPSNKSLIQNPTRLESFNDFSGEASKIVSDLNDDLLKSTKCISLKEQALVYRKAFLLNSKDYTLSQKLSQIYEEMGLNINALFYKSFFTPELDFLQKVIGHSETEIRLSGIRHLRRFPKEVSIPILEKLIDSLNSEEIINVANTFSFFDEKTRAIDTLINFSIKQSGNLGARCTFDESISESFDECVNRRYPLESGIMQVAEKAYILNEENPIGELKPVCIEVDLLDYPSICQVYSGIE